MDLKKTGAFIAQRRKEKGLTQSQLAAHLGVTDKAVSRWETGRGFPDVSTLPALAEALGVTVAELVNGEAAEPTRESTQDSAQDAVLASLEYAGSVKRRLLITLLAVGSLLCFFYAFIVVGASAVWLPLLGVMLLALAADIFWKPRRAARNRLKPRTARIDALLFLLAALALEFVPHGVRMRWATPSGEAERVTYCAYWDMLPAGYGNLFPLLTAVLTAVLLAFLLYRLLRPKEEGSRQIFIGSAVCLLFAALAAFLFAETPLPVALGILVCIFLSTALQYFALRAE